MEEHLSSSNACTDIPNTAGSRIKILLKLMPKVHCWPPPVHSFQTCSLPYYNKPMNSRLILLHYNLQHTGKVL